MSENYPKNYSVVEQMRRMIRGCAKCQSGKLCQTMQVVGACPYYRRINDGKKEESVG